jgi:hypothetical protein
VLLARSVLPAELAYVALLQVLGERADAVRAPAGERGRRARSVWTQLVVL